MLKIFFALLTAAMFCTASLPAADFSGEIPGLNLISESAKLEQSAGPSAIPGTTRSALLFRWNPLLAGWGQVHLKKREQVPDFTKAQFRIRVTAPASTPLSRINLRLIDASGEVFQFPKRAGLDHAGQYDLIYDVTSDPVNTKSIWGGDKNRKMNFPVSILGVSFEFVHNSGKGEIYLESIDFLGENKPAPQKTAIGNQAGQFLNAELTRKLLPVDCRTETVEEPENGVKVSFVPRKCEWFKLNFCPLYAMGSAADAPAVPDFQRAALEIGLHTGGPVDLKQVAAVFLDNNSGRQKIYKWSAALKLESAGNHLISIPVNLANQPKLEPPLRLIGLHFNAPPQSSGSFVLDRIALTDMTILPSNCLTLSLECASPFRVLKPGECPTIKLGNLLDRPLKGKLKLTVKDFDRTALPWHVETELALKGGETAAFVPEIPERSGIWYIGAEFTPDGKNREPVNLERSFVTMNATGATPKIKIPQGFIFGINSHPQRMPKSFDREADAIALCGAKVVRFAVGLPSDFTLLDQIVRDFSAKGINFDLIFSYVRKKRGSNEPNFEATRAALARLFSHYRGKVHYWELMNEPDITGYSPSTADYVKLAKLAREELDKADPDALLLSAGFCAFDFPGHGQYQRDVLVGTGKTFDLHCFHGHAPFDIYSETTIDTLLMGLRRKNHIAIPWYSNETGLTSANRTEKEQAYALFKKSLFAWSRGTIGYNWYCLRDKGGNPKSNEQNYGMFTYDFYPKAVYPVFNTLTSIYRYKKFVRQLELPEGFYAFEFKGPKEIVFPAWSENYSQLPIRIQSDAESAEVVDVLGNAVPAKRIGGAWLLPITEEPVSLRLHGAAKAEILPREVSVASAGVLIPGESVPLTLSLGNFGETPQTIDFTLQAPVGITLDSNHAAVALNPKSGREWETRLNVSRDFPVKYGTVTPLEVIYRAGNAAPVRFIFPMRMALPFRTEFGKEPLFTLDSKNQVVNFYDLDPHKLDMQWHGPEDLSAQVRLGATGTALLVGVAVTDDVHSQPYSKAENLDGDGVQLTFRMKEHALPCEIDGFHKDDGKSEVWVRWTPPGLKIDRAAAAAKIGLTTRREGNKTFYRFEIPLTLFGTGRDSLAQGFHFNLLVNDNDGNGRKGYIRIAPGIGNGIVYPRHPFLILK